MQFVQIAAKSNQNKTHNLLMEAAGSVPDDHTDKAAFDPFLACVLNPSLIVLTFNLHCGSTACFISLLQCKSSNPEMVAVSNQVLSNRDYLGLSG